MELHDLRIKYAQLEEENTELKEKLEETQFLQDLLEEKKKQTDFLQQQLEMRIRSYHQLENKPAARWQNWRNGGRQRVSLTVKNRLCLLTWNKTGSHLPAGRTYSAIRVHAGRITPAAGQPAIDHRRKASRYTTTSK